MRIFAVFVKSNHFLYPFWIKKGQVTLVMFLAACSCISDEKREIQQQAIRFQQNTNPETAAKNA